MQVKVCHSCGQKFNNPRELRKKTSRWRRCDQGHMWFNCQCGSTLMLKRHQSEWYRPEWAMSSEAMLFYRQMRNMQRDLPLLPPMITELQSLIHSRNNNASQVAQRLRLEPLLAAEILHLANCLRIGNQPIKSIEHAVAFIGRNMISDVITTAAIRQLPILAKNFDIDSHWQQAFLTAQTSEFICRRLIKQNPNDEIYLAACLMNLGKLVSAIAFPEETDQIIEFMNSHNVSWHVAEEQLAMPPHTVLGEIGAACWGLPQFICNASLCHHSVAFAKHRYHYHNTVQVVSFANQLIHWHRGEERHLDKPLIEEYWQLSMDKREHAEQAYIEFINSPSLLRT